jgi:hypothetical protein
MKQLIFLALIGLFIGCGNKNNQVAVNDNIPDTLLIYRDSVSWHTNSWMGVVPNDSVMNPVYAGGTQIVRNGFMVEVSLYGDSKAMRQLDSIIKIEKMKEITAEKLSAAQYKLLADLSKKKIRYEGHTVRTAKTLMKLGLVDFDSSYDYIILTERGKKIEL